MVVLLVLTYIAPAMAQAPGTVTNGDKEYQQYLVATVQMPVSSLEIWIDKLAKFESGNRATIRVLDTNNKYSYGCLQFQEGTFRQYIQRYQLLSGIDPMTRIYDCELQKQLAFLMISEKYANWGHWRNTVSKIGLPPR